MARRNNGEPTIRTKLSDSFVAALESDWQQNGSEVIKQLRESHVERYTELVGRIIVAEQNRAAAQPDTLMPTDSHGIAVKLLEDIGLTEPDDDACQRALVAYDSLISTLEQIRDDVLH